MNVSVQKSSTKDKHTTIDVGCSQSIHWSRQFSSRKDPARVAKCLDCIQHRSPRTPATSDHEDLKNVYGVRLEKSFKFKYYKNIFLSSYYYLTLFLSDK